MKLLVHLTPTSLSLIHSSLFRQGLTTWLKLRQLGYSDAEFDVTLRILMARKDLGVVRKRSQCLVESCVHFFWGALEESSAATDEKGVAGKDRSIIAVFEEIAYAVLSMAWCVESFHLDAFADGKSLTMTWCLGHLCTILATNNWDRIRLEDLGIASRVVVMAVKVSVLCIGRGDERTDW